MFSAVVGQNNVKGHNVSFFKGRKTLHTEVMRSYRIKNETLFRSCSCVDELLCLEVSIIYCLVNLDLLTEMYRSVAVPRSWDVWPGLRDGVMSCCYPLSLGEYTLMSGLNPGVIKDLIVMIFQLL